MSADRKTLNIMLAALDLEQKDLAKLMGYDRVYVGNVFNGFAQPSEAFKIAFGNAFADLILGASRVEQRHNLPARPLYEYLERRAASAPNRTQFYSDLGLSPHGWNHRKYVTEDLVDRVCCELGIHVSHIYGSEAA